MIESPVTQLLNRKSIHYDVIEIPLTDDKKPIRKLEELLQAENRDPHSVVRSLLFKTNTDEFVLLAVAGGGRADWAILRQQLGVRKLRMAEFDEVSEATGYKVGAVPPIALPETIRVLVDTSINSFEHVIIGSGVLGYALSLSSTDLLDLLNTAEHGKFVKD